ncbi:hypothetical protein C6495_00775 [Candidatus Poribacteria bacterium]|nr:MAG: hypothetical protein C6495_00775 [Candidatus Poribacteria bacterium]
MQDPILKAVEKLADQVEKLTNRFDSFIQNDFRELSREVSEIRGKLEGREEARSDARARRAEWIAAAAVIVAIGALIKSFL